VPAARAGSPECNAQAKCPTCLGLAWQRGILRSEHAVRAGRSRQSRIVYVDNDPIVLAHARALLTSGPEGATGYLDADARDTGKILIAAGDLLDFAQPVAVLLVAILQLIGDEDDPYALVAELMRAVPADSFLVSCTCQVTCSGRRRASPMPPRCSAGC
jgi:S-adenosyl methyltransferase